MPQPSKGPRLGGSPAHQKLMLANLATSLFTHGRIHTTRAKAERLRPYAERLITKAKRGDLHNRRVIAQQIRDKDVVGRLMAEIGPFFADRPGGYTRIVKTLPRRGDNAPMAIIELVNERTVASEAGRVTGAAAGRSAGTAGGAAAGATSAASGTSSTEASMGSTEEFGGGSGATTPDTDTTAAGTTEEVGGGSGAHTPGSAEADPSDAAGTTGDAPEGGSATTEQLGHGSGAHTADTDADAAPGATTTEEVGGGSGAHTPGSEERS